MYEDSLTHTMHRKNKISRCRVGPNLELPNFLNMHLRSLNAHSRVIKEILEYYMRALHVRYLSLLPYSE